MPPPLPPLCPKCYRAERVEEEDQSGSSATWFVCVRCRTRYTGQSRQGSVAFSEASASLNQSNSCRAVLGRPGQSRPSNVISPQREGLHHGAVKRFTVLSGTVRNVWTSWSGRDSKLYQIADINHNRRAVRRRGMTPERNQPPDAVPAPAKKSYSKPRLQVYGNLRDLTRHVGSSGNPDPPPHASLSNMKTH